MTNLDSVLRSKDMTLLTMVRIVQVTVFPVVMYGCENWTVKKTEYHRINIFKLWCWRRLVRSNPGGNRVHFPLSDLTKLF